MTRDGWSCAQAPDSRHSIRLFAPAFRPDNFDTATLLERPRRYALTMSRRQNSSCDQCRKGKRACDAIWLRDRNIQRTVGAQRVKPAAPAAAAPAAAAPLATSATPSQRAFDDQLELIGPCTNCVRTNKECTFEWVHSQRKGLASSNISTTSSRQENSSVTASTASQSPDPSDMLLHPLGPSIQAPMPNHSYLPYTYPTTLTAEEQLLAHTCSYPTSGPEGPNVPTSASGLAFRDHSHATGEAPVSLSTDAHMLMGMREDDQHDQPSFLNVPRELADYDPGPFTSGPASRPNDRTFHHSSEVTTTFASNAWPISAETTSNALSSVEVRHTNKRRRTQSPVHLLSPPPTSAPSWDPMTGERLARTTNRGLIGETMMKIYDDVMEGALSCWLVEQTCPYKSLPPTPGPDVPDAQRFGIFEDMQKEWGSNWSNRIYRRVVRLDRMAHILGVKKLNPMEERKVSHALSSAVMAFTAQWAQSSRRSSARWPGANGIIGHMFQSPDADIEEELDRTLQKSFWNQARRALDECSEIDSFRVAFAEIIYGLTQKYAETPESQPDPIVVDNDADTSEAVNDILRGDKQQLWVERATRRLHVLRRRVELSDRQKRGTNDGVHSLDDAEHRKTIDLLFWLAVMFDTISAAMTERPLTVSDEDSGNLSPSQPSLPAAYPTSRVAKGWNMILTKDQQTKITSLRWPLSDKVIAQELADAAPVKVLLYRKITRLQTLLARNSDATTIEDTIEDASMVYRHWQLLYNPLFSDCIDNHLSLPARIQSWYACLLGHWLLATLLFADLIQCVDQCGLGLAAETRRRIEAGRAAGIRRASVRMVSDLARASTPRDDAQGQLDNFHDAVSDGALLTEPWTMILIRTFSRAAIALLGDLRPPDGDTSIPELPADYRADFERCEDCVKALWYLGRKSDMARQVANVLAISLQKERLEPRI